jgi:hypothetical protein
MCGLLGLISRQQGGFFSRDLDMLEWMSIINTIRGKDSTGFFTAYRNKQAEVIKIGTHPFNLFQCKEWGAFRNSVTNRGKFVVCHNRAATRGKVSTENAHPFVENNIILAHNGTLWNHSNLSKDKEVEVDSHAIAIALAEKPASEVLPTIDGAFALIWYNTETEKLYAARNDERPLSLLINREFLVLSSEPWIAASPMTRFDKKIDDIVDIKPGTIWEFDINNGGKFTTSEFELKKFSPRTTVTPITGRGQTGNNKGASNPTRQAVEDQQSRYMDCGEGCDDDEDSSFFQEAEIEGSGVPPQIRELRQALTAQAKGKESRAGLKSCALTSVGGGTAGHMGAELKLRPIDRTADVNTRTLQIDHETLKRGRTVLFKPIEVQPVGQDLNRFTGKIHEADEKLYDCIGYYPEHVTRPEIQREMLGKLCVGRVVYVTETVGGITVYLTDITVAAITSTFGQSRTPVAYWSHALCYGKCMKCNKGIHGWEREFCSVHGGAAMEKGSDLPINRVKMICPSCIKATLKGEILETFDKKYNQVASAISQSRKLQQQPGSPGWSKEAGGEATPSDHSDSVSDGKPLSKEPVGKNGSVIVVQAPPTIQ